MKTGEKSAKHTLLMSVLMSLPGPLIVGWGFIEGKSVTQAADFVRRSSELLAIIVSFTVYCIINKDNFKDNAKKNTLERNTDILVGICMCVGGTGMILLSVMSDSSDTGNVIPGLCVALLGFIANGIFTLRYTKLGNTSKNSILIVQGKLYRAKTLVDFCISCSLLSVLYFPGSVFSAVADKSGSVIVSCYMIYTGISTVKNRIK